MTEPSSQPGKDKTQVTLAAVAIGAILAAVLGYRYFGRPSCDQLEAAASLDLDRDQGATALAVMEKAPDKCRTMPSMRGRHAEALVRTGRNEEAMAEANEVLASQPQDPYATYALAQSQHAAGNFVDARKNAEAAVQRGRGLPAQLLLGNLAFKMGDYAVARSSYNAILKANPDDVTAVYNLALVDQQQNRYRDAREGYLKVLRLDPKHLDARFNLAILTHNAGATMEAQHHLQKLMEAAPGDARVERLKAALAVPPPKSALVVGGPAASDAPAAPATSASAAGSR